MDDEQLKKLGVGEEQLERALREALGKGFLDELVVFGLASYLKQVIETAVTQLDGLDEFPPVVEFEIPKRGVKVVVSIEKIGG